MRVPTLILITLLSALSWAQANESIEATTAVASQGEVYTQVADNHPCHVQADLFEYPVITYGVNKKETLNNWEDVVQTMKSYRDKGLCQIPASSTCTIKTSMMRIHTVYVGDGQLVHTIRRSLAEEALEKAKKAGLCQ